MEIQKTFEKLINHLQVQYNNLNQIKQTEQQFLIKFEKVREFAINLFNLLTENRPIWNKEFLNEKESSDQNIEEID